MNDTQRPDIYAEITNKFIDALEKGTRPWQKPWTSIGGPRNAVTDRPYSGINKLVCMLEAASQDGDPRFCTFKQAKDAGWSVKKGAKAIHLVKWVELEKKPKFDNKEKEEEITDTELSTERKVLIPVGFSVFHASQIAGIPPLEKTQVADHSEDIKRTQALADTLSVRLVHTGDRAYYTRDFDQVVMPPVEAFKSSMDYAGTLLHELAHSTGHEKRLNRTFGKAFGDENYAKEELRAELGSVFMATTRDLPLSEEHFEKHSAYLASWIAALKNDKKELFRAASDAEKIDAYVTKLELSERQETFLVQTDIQTEKRTLKV